jgi:hypothetical protein
MKKCTGNNTQERGFDAVFELECPRCGIMVAFFKDDIIRKCACCHKTVVNNRKDCGCGPWCSSSSPHQRNLCSK